MNLKPLGDRVIVKVGKGEEKTKSGIIIPDTAKQKPNEGEIVAVGAGKKNEAGSIIPMEIKVGDKVMYEKYAGKEVKVNGEDFMIVSQDDVIAIIG
ncbi:co-chaperone GroES [bacterium]